MTTEAIEREGMRSLELCEVAAAAQVHVRATRARSARIAATVLLCVVASSMLGCGGRRGGRGGGDAGAGRDGGVGGDAGAERDGGGGGDAGGGGDTTRNTVVFVEDSYQTTFGGASLDLLIDGALVSLAGEPFGRDYPGAVRGVAPGLHDIVLRNNFDDTTVYADSVVTSAEGTLLWLSGSESRRTLRLLSAPAWAAPPGPDRGVIRTVHSAPRLGPIDVYVLPRGGTIAGASPAFSGVAPETITDFVAMPVGDITVIITQAGSSTMVGMPLDGSINPDFASLAVATENCFTMECTTPEARLSGFICLGVSPMHCYRE